MIENSNTQIKARLAEMDQRWPEINICDQCGTKPPKNTSWQEDHMWAKGRGYTIILCDKCRNKNFHEVL